MTDLALKHGLSFSDLYERDGLIRLDRAFVAHLAATDVGLHARLMAGRADPEALDRKAESDLLVDLAPHVEDFLGELFGIAGEVRALQARDGFALTDPGTDLAGALDQANYCIWCHNQGKDSCRSGLHEKDGSFKKSVFGVTLAGCPLDEKISEMNLVKARGYSLGALAIVA